MPGLSQWLQKPPLGTQLNRSHPLAPNVLALSLSEGAGSYVNNSALYPGYIGTFDNTPAKLWVGDRVDFSTNTCIQVGYWKPWKTVSIVFGAYLPANGNFEYYANCGDDTTFNFYLRKTNTNTLFAYCNFTNLTTDAITSGYYTIGMVILGSTLTVWINGKKYTTSGAGTLDTNGVNYSIGSRAKSSFTLFDYRSDMQLTYFYQWDRAISDADYMSLYANPFQVYQSPVPYPILSEPPAGGITASIGGVAGANIGKIIGVDAANVGKVAGVEV